MLLVSAALAQDVSISDSLATGSSATTIYGGTFTGSGWHVDDANSRMFWDFGTQVERGEVSVTIDGITLDSMGPANNHVIELFDSGGHWSSNRAVNVRIYGNGSPDEAGQVKLKCWDPTGAAEARTPALTWDGSPHRFRVTWDTHSCALYLDGSELLNLDTGGLDLRVGTLWLPLNDWTGDYSGVVGSTYHDLALSAWEPGEAPDPVDDGDPNTLTPVSDVTAANWESGVYSDDTDLCVESSGGSPTAITYLRYDLSAISGTITHATLTLHARTDHSAEGDGGTVYRVPDTGWDEDSLTWGSRLTVGDAIGSFPAVSPGETYVVDVTGAVTAGSAASFALISGGENGAHFSSKEDGDGSAAPLLTIAVSDVESDADTDADTDADADADTDTDTDSGYYDDWEPRTPPNQDASDATDTGSGCGCGTTRSPAGALVVLGALLAMRRRR
jgi:MYXO-CTERM domain-containing protein